MLSKQDWSPQSAATSRPRPAVLAASRESSARATVPQTRLTWVATAAARWTGWGVRKRGVLFSEGSSMPRATFHRMVAIKKLARPSRQAY